MTLILGCIHEDLTVHIIADSAVTFTNHDVSKGQTRNTDLSMNSFGENIESDENQTVKEISNKVYKLSPTVLAAFSGSTFEGRQTLEELAIRLKIFSDTECSHVISDFFKEACPSHSEYIIAFINESYPMIYYYKLKEAGFINKPKNYIILGNAVEMEYIVEPFEMYLNLFLKSQIQPEKLCVILVALLESLSINSRSFHSGVGGYFNGAFLSKDKITWNADVCNFMYSFRIVDKKESEKFVLTKYNRDDAVYVRSSKIGEAVFMNSSFGIKPDYHKWKVKWEAELKSRSSQLSADYVVFMCYDSRIITIFLTSGKKFQQLLPVFKVAENEIEIRMSKILLHYLLKHPPEIDNVSWLNQGLPITINFIDN